jgi:hypothetical protein
MAVTGVIGGGIVACGVITALAVADVPMAFVAVASFGLLGVFGAAARLQGRGRHAARRARAAAARPRWTDSDREWLREHRAVLTGPQEKAGPR